MHPMFAELFMKPDEELEAGDRRRRRRYGGPVSSGLFRRPAVRQVSPGARRVRAPGAAWRLACAHAADGVGLDRHDHPCLGASAEVRIRPAEVLAGDLVDALRAALGCGRDDVAAHREVAPGVAGIDDVHRHARVTGDVARLLRVVWCVDQDVLAVGTDPGLGELRRAVGHDRRNEAQARTPEEVT
jgi:hypothetical protein